MTTKGSSALLGRLGRHGCGIDQFGELKQGSGKTTCHNKTSLYTRCLKVPKPLPEILRRLRLPKEKNIKTPHVKAMTGGFWRSRGRDCFNYLDGGFKYFDDEEWKVFGGL